MPDNRALDIRLAKLRGWTVRSNGSGLFYLYDPEQEVPFPFQFCWEEREAWESCPDYTASLDAHFRDVWPEIGRRGLDEAYLTKLAEMGWNTDGDPWLLLKVPPEQHTRAAIAVLERKS